eukprot:CAMPEP_0185547044 /NCGR_PEP_ID=MMETSP1381-20130426/5874_1 /TAXON_ID=298111 /ORGANISM="Pavlova sp., Strain CCMP459" /LENGTH=134 /DNA_ID=CAMNT_0028159555 /DNA_START=229 /DNA_END=630 /DNA_ORIENTATION=+
MLAAAVLTDHVGSLLLVPIRIMRRQRQGKPLQRAPEVAVVPSVDPHSLPAFPFPHVERLQLRVVILKLAALSRFAPLRKAGAACAIVQTSSWHRSVTRPRGLPSKEVSDIAGDHVAGLRTVCEAVHRQGRPRLS